MAFFARAKFLRYSPYKLRALAAPLRGKRVEEALAVLTFCALKRALPLRKVIASAAANAMSSEKDVRGENLIIQELRIDEGPSYHYYKPGGRGRADELKKRLSHVTVVLAQVNEKQTKRGR